MRTGNYASLKADENNADTEAAIRPFQIQEADRCSNALARKDQDWLLRIEIPGTAQANGRLAHGMEAAREKPHLPRRGEKKTVEDFRNEEEHNGERIRHSLLAPGP